MAKTLEEWKEQAALAQELGDIEAELEAREAIDELSLPVGNEFDAVKEAVTNVASPFTGKAVGGLAGLPVFLAEKLGLADEGKAVEVIDAIEEYFQYEPKTQAGEQRIQTMQESKGMQALAGGIETVQEAVAPYPEALADAGLHGLAAVTKGVLHSAPEAVGLASGMPVIAAGTKQAGKVVDKGKTAVRNRAETKQDIVNRISSGEPTVRDIGYDVERVSSDEIPQVSISEGDVSQRLLPKLDEVVEVDAIPDEVMPEFSSKLIKNPVEKQAQKSGINDKTILRIKKANPATKREMRNMLEVHRKGLDDPTYGDRNRASKVVGQSILKRVKHLEDVKADAVDRLDAVAGTLKERPVNLAEPVQNYLADLEKLGVIVNRETGELDFTKSALKGKNGAGSRELLREVFSEIKRGGTTGFDGHMFKKFLDIETDIGKKTTARPVASQVMGLTKKLRGEIDDVLDSTFPAYDDVNTRYKDTIEAVDNFDSLMSAEMDTGSLRAADNLGTLMRRVYNNTQSRDRLINAIDNVNEVSARYGAKFTDDPIALGAFANSLDNHLGMMQETSLAADVARGSQDAQRAAAAVATKGASEVAGGAFDKFGEFRAGKRREAINKSFDELLNTGK